MEKALQTTGRELANLRMTHATDMERMRTEMDAERQAAKAIKVRPAGEPASDGRQ